MPGIGTLTAGPALGLFGKLPAHGDFVRRGLPGSFVTPWDAWLQAGMGAAQAVLRDTWPDAWAAAPAWRFALPAGACGPDAVAGVLLASYDSVGRRFPLTAAAVRPGPAAPWPAVWFGPLEGVLRWAREAGIDVDAVHAGLPRPDAMQDARIDLIGGPAAYCACGSTAGSTPETVGEPCAAPPADVAPAGWWTADTIGAPGLLWPHPTLPPADAFHLLLGAPP